MLKSGKTTIIIVAIVIVGAIALSVAAYHAIAGLMHSMEALAVTSMY